MPRTVVPKPLPLTGFVTKPVVLSIAPFGRTKLKAEIQAGRFPTPIRFSPRIEAWRAEDLRAWIASQGRAA